MKHYYAVFFILFASLVLRGQETVSDGRSSSRPFEFKIYPNPVTSGLVNITTGDFHQKQVHIYNVFGIRVLAAELKGDKTLDISGLDKGVYIIRLVQNERVATRKLIIK